MIFPELVCYFQLFTVPVADL